ncbi:MAG: hypothetical protein P4L40_05005 [Terracidiphilus sp.]|nr:hypothetical protein [Terracidiphilus sp.]
MRPLARISLLLLACSVVVSAQSNRKPSALFQRATYVYVQAENGDINSRKITAADRQAISDVENAIRAWGRYKLTVDRKNAELIFVVRKGRTVSTTPHAGIPAGAPPAPITFPGGRKSPQGQDPAESPDATGVSTEAGPALDQLTVYSVSPEGDRGYVIWHEEDKGGLVHPYIPLFKDLRDEVEDAYPSQPSKP